MQIIMSCYRCAEKFKLFNKEVGCANCGFGFCSKCCNNKTNVPKKDNQLLKVCQKCYDLLTGKSNQSEKTTEVTPPKNFLKLVESNKVKQNKDVSSEDKQLYDRLEKLKNENKANVISSSDKDLESRLRNLQGVSNETSKLSNLPTKETIKTSDDLISKILDEVEIEKKHGDFEKQEIEKLEKRLKNLQASTNNPTGSNIPNDAAEIKPNSSSLNPVLSNSSDPTDEIMKKMLREADEFQKKLKDDYEDQDFSCCICNDDSNKNMIKCIDCEDDFYCSRCFKQTHSTGEYKRHKFIKNS